MAKMDDRMKMIGAAIIGQAQQEAREIIDRANEIRERELKMFEDEIVTNMFANVQQKAANVRLESVKAVARAQTEARAKLLLHRQKLADSVFEGARARLAEFAGSPAYIEWLKEKAAAVAGEYDHTDSTLFLSPRDAGLADDLLVMFSGALFREDKTIRLGGFRLRNDHTRVLVDETLDELLEAQHPWFLMNCGLKTV